MTLWIAEDSVPTATELSHDVVSRGLARPKIIRDVSQFERCLGEVQDNDLVTLDSQMPEDDRNIRMNVRAGIQIAARLRAENRKCHLLWHSRSQMPSELRKLVVEDFSAHTHGRIAHKMLIDRIVALEHDTKPANISSEVAEFARELLGETKTEVAKAVLSALTQIGGLLELYGANNATFEEVLHNLDASSNHSEWSQLKLAIRRYAYACIVKLEDAKEIEEWILGKPTGANIQTGLQGLGDSAGIRRLLEKLGRPADILKKIYDLSLCSTPQKWNGEDESPPSLVALRREWLE